MSDLADDELELDDDEFIVWINSEGVCGPGLVCDLDMDEWLRLVRLARNGAAARRRAKADGMREASKIALGYVSYEVRMRADKIEAGEA